MNITDLSKIIDDDINQHCRKYGVVIVTKQDVQDMADRLYTELEITNKEEFEEIVNVLVSERHTIQ